MLLKERKSAPDPEKARKEVPTPGQQGRADF